MLHVYKGLGDHMCCFFHVLVDHVWLDSLPGNQYDHAFTVQGKFHRHFAVQSIYVDILFDQNNQTEIKIYQMIPHNDEVYSELSYISKIIQVCFLTYMLPCMWWWWSTPSRFAHTVGIPIWCSLFFGQVWRYQDDPIGTWDTWVNRVGLVCMHMCV